MGAFTYPRSEPGSAGHQDLVERLNTLAFTLRRELGDLSDDVASRRPGAGEWSIKEILGHLCDDARHLHVRLFRVINQEQPLLPAWQQEEALRERDAQSASLASLLDELSTQRGETVDMLADLVHWNWSRQGRHEEYGRLSVRQLVDRAIAHDEDHLEHLRKTKENALARSG